MPDDLSDHLPDGLPVASVRKPVRLRAVPAVTRSIAILRLLGEKRAGLGVKAIADELGLVPSTCLHILRVLVAENFVRVDPETRRYSLGSGMVSIARSLLGDSTFASLSQPSLERIARERRITVMGAEITPRRTILVLSVVRPDQPVRLHADVGSEFPGLTSATGRLVAAFGGLDEARLRSLFPAIEWDNPPDLSQWLQEVAEAREQGWSVDRDRFKNGITAYAVPVLDRAGRISHSLVAMGLTADMALLDELALAGDMRREAAAIARELHHA